MSTLVFFHAHPDDEAIATGGTMAGAAAAGHRVVLVIATNGEEGEVAEGFLGEGEALATVRIAEAERSGRLLGAERVVFLGYRDSGMMGEATNDHADCFWQADVEDAAARLAGILEEEKADVLTVYDARRRVRPSRSHPGAPRRSSGRVHRRDPVRAGSNHEPGSDPAMALDDGRGGTRHGRNSR